MGARNELDDAVKSPAVSNRDVHRVVVHTLLYLLIVLPNVHGHMKFGHV